MSKIIWFTGLSGSGKSTLSNSLFRILKRNKKKSFRLMATHFEKIKIIKITFQKK